MTQPAPTFPLMAGFEEYEGFPLTEVIDSISNDPKYIQEREANYDFWLGLDSWVWNDKDLTKERMTEVYADNLIIRDLWELARNEPDQDARINLMFLRTYIQIPS